MNNRLLRNPETEAEIYSCEFAVCAAALYDLAAISESVERTQVTADGKAIGVPHKTELTKRADSLRNEAFSRLGSMLDITDFCFMGVDG